MAKKPTASQQRPKVSRDEVEQRKEMAEKLMMTFTEEWVMLLAGYDVECDSMDPALAEQIKRTVEPFLAKGDRVIPKFDTYAQARLFVSIPNLLNTANPIRGELEMVSRCEWTRGNGVMLRVSPQRITTQLTMNGELTKVLSAKFVVQEL